MTEEESTAKLRDYFFTYYNNWDFASPERLQSRELGFIPFSGTMVRHRKVNSTKEMDSFVKTTVPRHMYYSSAYYRKPDEKKMQEKEWLGAELIFDLDADHVQAEKKITYEETLTMIREHTVRLIENYLIRDMGFEESELRVFFSGGRGYHVHVLSDRVYSMTSDSRREIATYIKGEGINLEEFLKVYRYVPLNHGGWVQSLSGLIMSESASAGKKGAEFNALSEITALKGSGVQARKRMSKKAGELIDLEMAEIDEPVTTDTHRLIRYPHSLHGKTGFMVKEVPFESLNEFEPLEECIPETFKDGVETVNVDHTFRINLMGNRYELNKGKCKVPLFVALYTVLSGKGEFI